MSLGPVGGVVGSQDRPGIWYVDYKYYNVTVIGYFVELPAAITTVTARVFDFSAFSIRSDGEFKPKDGSVTIDLVSGKGSGPVCGGTKVVLKSTEGGLGWVKVAFGKYYDSNGNLLADQSIDGVVNGVARAEVTKFDNLGADEYLLELRLPKYKRGGVVDIAIYDPSNVETPVYVIKNSFKYNDLSPLWITLGVIGGGIGIGFGVDAVLDQPSDGSGGGGGGGPCFIATAAYGTPLAANIDMLRAFRDNYLLNTGPGTAVVDAYYRVSPFIADAVAQSPVLATMVRLLIAPLIFLAKAPVLSVFLLASILIRLVFVFRRRWAKPQKHNSIVRHRSRKAVLPAFVGTGCLISPSNSLLVFTSSSTIEQHNKSLSDRCMFPSI